MRPFHYPVQVQVRRVRPAGGFPLADFRYRFPRNHLKPDMWHLKKCPVFSPVGISRTVPQQRSSSSSSSSFAEPRGGESGASTAIPPPPTESSFTGGLQTGKCSTAAGSFCLHGAEMRQIWAQNDTAEASSRSCSVVQERRRSWADLKQLQIKAQLRHVDKRRI